MKRILLSLFLVYSLGAIAQSQVTITEISGLYTVCDGGRVLYVVRYNNTTGSTAAVGVEVSEHGKFDDSKRTMTKYVGIGQGTFDFYVHWDNVTTKDAYIKAGGIGGTPTTLKIEIKNILNSLTLNGPDKLSRAQIGTFTAYTSCGTFTNVSWSLNSDKAKITEVNQNVAKVQALAGGVNVILTAQIKDQNKVLRTLTKTIALESIFEISGPDLICSNSNGIFSILYIEEAPGAKITWSAIKNAVLKSGQGTSKATFTGNGNGTGEVQAIIEYNGKKSTVNKTFWTGLPTTDILIDGEYNTSPNLRYTYIIKGIGAGNTVSKWDIRPPLTMISSSALGVTVSTSSISANVPFLVGEIVAYIKNSCGETIISRQINIVNPKYKGPPIAEMSMPVSMLIEEQPITSIRVYSLTTGSIVYTEKNTVNFNIQNTNLKAGIYILETTNEEGKVTREKVMKKDY